MLVQFSANMGSLHHFSSKQELQNPAHLARLFSCATNLFSTSTPVVLQRESGGLNLYQGSRMQKKLNSPGADKYTNLWANPRMKIISIMKILAETIKIFDHDSTASLWCSDSKWIIFAGRLIVWTEFQWEIFIIIWSNLTIAYFMVRKINELNIASNINMRFTPI